jgi:hypothetical protein
MVAGGLAIRKARYHEIEHHIQSIKEAAHINSEMHWADYKGGARRAAYEKLVDFAFLLVNERQAALHILIAHFAAFNHKRKSPDDRCETSVNRMYYQLAVHRLCNFYGQKCAIHIFPDAGKDSADLPNFRNMICADGYHKYKTIPNCIRSIEPQCSKRHNIIQMVDVVIGAIAAKRNDRKNVAHKAELADYVLEKSGHGDWSRDTVKNARYFTVWNFKHQ